MKYYISVSDRRTEILKSMFYSYELCHNLSELSAGDTLVFSPSKRVELCDVCNLNNNITIFGGLFSEEAKRQITLKNILCIGSNDDEVFAVENSLLTAEATLSIIITNTNKRLCELKTIILGGGRLAKALAVYLTKLNCPCDCFTYNEKEYIDLKYLGVNLGKKFKSYDVIINTIPLENHFDAHLNEVSSKAIYLELASKKSLSENENRNFKYILCPSLPEKYSPESAAFFIKQSLDRRKQ